jgi:hypothetical protein
MPLEEMLHVSPHSICGRFPYYRRRGGDPYRLRA